MKKTLIATALLSLLAASTSASASEGELSWVGVAVGVNNKDSTTPAGAYVSGSRQTNVDLRIGRAWDLGVKGHYNQRLAGVEVNLLMLNSKMIAMPQAVFLYGSQFEPQVMPHIGFAADTGVTGGVDMLVPVSFGGLSVQSMNAIRLGITTFQKPVSGAKAIFQVGMQQTF